MALGENLNVHYDLAAGLIAGLTGPACTICMRMGVPSVPLEGMETALRDFSGQAKAYRNSPGLDNVMAVLSGSPLVKKLPARQSELLYSSFSDDNLACRLGEPITTWLVRYQEALGKLKAVNINVVSLLPDIAGWQALNLAGLSEDSLECVVSKLPDYSYPLDSIIMERNCVYATIHIGERSGSGPAIQPNRSSTSGDVRQHRPCET